MFSRCSHSYMANNKVLLMHHSEYQHLYNNKGWRKESKRFLYAHPFCKYCGKQADVVNHKIPHKGDIVLFWSKDNWESVCKQCHDSTVQRLERGQIPGKDMVIDNRSNADGLPTSSTHPWNIKEK